MKINEIDKIYGSDYSGEDDFQWSPEQVKNMSRGAKPLPGTGYYWTTTRTDGAFFIVIIDPAYPDEDEFDDDEDEYAPKISPGVIAFLMIEQTINIGKIKIMEVNAIATRKQYRGQGLASALYLIAMRQLNCWIRSGGSQTPAGRRAWVRLNQIPGVQVEGLIEVEDDAFDDYTADKLIDNLMQVGFNNIGEERADWRASSPGRMNHFFTFPVRRGKGELVNAIRKAKFNTYGNRNVPWNDDVSLVAHWVGNK